MISWRKVKARLSCRVNLYEEEKEECGKRQNESFIMLREG